jgi:protein SCO1/2
MRAVILAATVALALSPARAQDRTEPVPKPLAHVGVTEHLGQPLPLDLAFADEDGRPVTLGAFFGPGRPVILTLNYYRCPMLCTYELNGLVQGMKGLPWTAGSEFDVVTVSIDPRERPELAAAKKRTYIEGYGRPAAASGWHFLTGSSASIEGLARAAGFEYEYDRETDQYGHAAVILLVTPDGHVSRYLYGVQFEPDTLKLALLEASRGKIGSALERFILYCYHYDAGRGRYSLAAMKIMRAGAALSVLILGTAVSGLWIRDRRRRRESAESVRS